MSRRRYSMFCNGWSYPKYRIQPHQVTKQRTATRSFPFSRRLRVEPLEDRRLLSITVNTLVDEADGSIVDGDISLRDAIAPAGETIDFSVTGTINLTSLGQLVIDKNLTISGPGANLLTINAFDPTPAELDGSRVFRIEDENTTVNKNVTIRGLTLTGGDPGFSGGAISNTENLTVAACTISGNSVTRRFEYGGGIYSNGASLRVSASTISGNIAENGGGIFMLGGTLLVDRSTISGNIATFLGGGGIYTRGTSLTVDQSTISGNLVSGNGGGIFCSLWQREHHGLHDHRKLSGVRRRRHRQLHGVGWYANDDHELHDQRKLNNRSRRRRKKQQWTHDHSAQHYYQ